MKAKDLIQELQKVPPDAEVKYLHHGGLRGGIDVVYTSRAGDCALAEYGENVYDLKERPKGAPDDLYWKIPIGSNTNTGDNT